MPQDYCPTATQDIELNTQNRDKAIQLFDYGPPNPREPASWFWVRLARRWGVPPTSYGMAELRKMRCGNCSVFDISPKMRECLPLVSSEDEYDQAAELKGSVFGYCWAHDFKCASVRTCATWAAGGPVKDDAKSPLRKEAKNGPHSR